MLYTDPHTSALLERLFSATWERRKQKRRSGWWWVRLKASHTMDHTIESNAGSSREEIVPLCFTLMCCFWFPYGVGHPSRRHNGRPGSSGWPLCGGRAGALGVQEAKETAFVSPEEVGGVRFLFSAITSTARAVSCKESQFPLGGTHRRTRGSGHKLQQQTSNIRRRFFPSKWLSTGAC